MDPILIVAISAGLVAILVVALLIRSSKVRALSRQQTDLIKTFAAEKGLTIEFTPSDSIEWTIITPEWLIYFDSDKHASESSSPRLQLSSLLTLNSPPEFIAVSNNVRKALGNGMMRSMTTKLTPDLVFSSSQPGKIPFAKIYDLIDRNTTAPLGKNEDPYVAIFANSNQSLKTVLQSQIPALSDQLNAGEKRVHYDSSPHLIKINPHLEIVAHCDYPTLEKVKALIALFDAVKAIS